jgi:hypothetical protein
MPIAHLAHGYLGAGQRRVISEPYFSHCRIEQGLDVLHTLLELIDAANSVVRSSPLRVQEWRF